MPPTGRMRHLTTVRGSFHGRVLVARLGAAGILAELRGASDGPYPFQEQVDVFVAEADFGQAVELLLAEAVDDAIDDDAIEAEFAHGVGELDPAAYEPGRIERGLASQQRRLDRVGTIVALALVVALIVVGLAVTAR